MFRGLPWRCKLVFLACLLKLHTFSEFVKVDLGQGIHLNLHVWEEVDSSGKDTIFVKEMTVALYGPTELMERSTKGKWYP